MIIGMKLEYAHNFLLTCFTCFWRTFLPAYVCFCVVSDLMCGCVLRLGVCRQANGAL